MKRYGVRPSVHPSRAPQQQTRCCCRFAAVNLASRRYQSIAAAAACGRQIQELPHGQHTRLLSNQKCHSCGWWHRQFTTYTLVNKSNLNHWIDIAFRSSELSWIFDSNENNEVQVVPHVVFLVAVFLKRNCLVVERCSFQACTENLYTKTHCTILHATTVNKLSPWGRWDNMPPPMAFNLQWIYVRPSTDGSAVRTSPVAGQLQAASFPIA